MASVDTYLRAIQENVANGVATEHTYRPALKTFLDSLEKGINAINEPRRIECGVPDFSVIRKTDHGPRTLGYVEAKDIGADLAAIERDSERASPSSRDAQQLKRYREALSNLVFTDYLEFRWYVNGQRRSVARLASVDGRGRLAADRDGESGVLALLGDFLAHEPEPIARPRELAERMARLTHLIRDVVVEAFDKNIASLTLRDLRDAFAKVLIPDLTVSAFGDMFAQTLSYGLFAARVEHDPSLGPFRRQDAAREIPRTNPFLRRLFGAIAGPDLDDEPFAGLVDDLAQLLASTDLGAVLADFGKRQARTDPVMHFYETFLAAFDPALRKGRGVYYTPEPVVSYIVRSVDHLLRTRFNCPDGLADTSTTTYTITGDDAKPHDAQGPKVLVLDPACGTGTFLYSVIDHIRSEFMRQGNAGKWSGYVREGLLPRLFGFELLMAPYAMAHLKLGMQLAAMDLPGELHRDWAYDFASGERLGVYLTNTLEEAIKRSQMLMGQFISDEANAAVAIKRERPIMVVLGNPPYSGHSANRGLWISTLVRDYYQVDGQPLQERNPKWLQDDYVKFVRFGQWRIQQTGQGVLAFITNHGYLDNPTFRGMRQQLMDSFTDIYILDLHGNTKKKERAPDGGPDKNVFDIQQGVAIGIFVKEPNKEGPATVHHADLWGTRESKYAWLMEHDTSATSWEELAPQSPFYPFTPQETDLAAEYEGGWKIPDVFPVNGVGMTTARDHVVIDYDSGPLLQRATFFRDSKDSNARLCEELGIPEKLGWNISRARLLISQEKDLAQYIKPVLYRPFDQRLIFFHDSLVWRTVKQVMRHMLAGENLGLIATRMTRDPWNALVTRLICGHKSMAGYDINSLFPLYLYPAAEGAPNKQADMAGVSPRSEGKGGRRPNLDPGFVKDVEKRLGMRFEPHPRLSAAPSPLAERGTGGEVGESAWRTPPGLWEKLKPLARQMRRNPTPEEGLLWQRLRNRRLLGFRFRRQHPIDRFILDFYCSEAWLAVEVDGPIHQYSRQEDAQRQAFLEAQGLRVLRFTSEEVAGSLDDAMEKLAEALRSLERGSGPIPSTEQTFGPEDVFHYIYAIFHSPAYRERYAQFLKMDFPRVPLTSNPDLFRALVEQGEELSGLHLLESSALKQGITRYPVPGDNVVEPGHPRYLAPGEPEPGTGRPLMQGRVYISKDNPKTGKRGQYIEGVPPEVWQFQVGGYQVCDKWLKDRRGRALTNADLEHYERVVVALQETIRVMAEIDGTIEQHGGWPLL